MKLALVRQKYNPYGGAERFVERALAALGAQGIAATLITREWQGPPGQAVRICNPFHLGRLWRDRGFARGVQAIIARGEFDLVQSHERIPGCDIYRAGDGVHATWLELRDRTRSAAARAATRFNPWHRYTLAAEAALFRHPRLQAVICNSRMVRDDIARRFGVDDAHLHVIGNGIDLAQFHPGLRQAHRARLRAELGLAAAAPVVLFVGSGFERKGVPALLQALARLQHRDAQLLVVGSDRRAAALRALAGRLGVEGRVRFVGGQADVRPFYGAADVFCLPTLYDPMPNAALEALACGLPVVTSSDCGAAELIEAGRNGFVCGARDVAALAGHLDALCAPGAAAGLAAAARASVAGLDLESMARRLAALYGALAPRPPAPPPL